MAETEHAQRVPDAESAQQMRMRERQRFFEEVFQHDVDGYLSSAHLQIGYKRPSSPALGHTDIEEDGLRRSDVSLRIADPCEIKSRMLSTSSNSTCDSQASNEDGSNTPIVQSDDEDVHEDSLHVVSSDGYQRS
ncbi:dysbindin-like [Sinocyclocheilus rhinocerous]|uniref:dysbindin-like n=1 Tax=Sinocyclocheilus rhinocerous TaxID=307959 RepID=UPI0007BAAE28|nr:PREDICTED: dysbindin-like [Sinocyclocheilus rhinocerous]